MSGLIDDQEPSTTSHCYYHSCLLVSILDGPWWPQHRRVTQDFFYSRAASVTLHITLQACFLRADVLISAPMGPCSVHWWTFVLSICLSRSWPFPSKTVQRTLGQTTSKICTAVPPGIDAHLNRLSALEERQALGALEFSSVQGIFWGGIPIHHRFFSFCFVLSSEMNKTPSFATQTARRTAKATSVKLCTECHHSINTLLTFPSGLWEVLGASSHQCTNFYFSLLHRVFCADFQTLCASDFPVGVGSSSASRWRLLFG